MTRNKLFAAAAIIAAVVLTACSDMTAPKNDVCPVVNGSSTCIGHYTRSGPRGLPVNLYVAATAVLRSSDIARTTVLISSGTHAGDATNGLLGRATVRIAERAACALNETR